MQTKTYKKDSSANWYFEVLGKWIVGTVFLAVLPNNLVHGQEYWWTSGNGLWSHPLNWAPFGPPGINDHARIGGWIGVGGLSVVLDENARVHDLTLTAGMDLVNDGYRLRVDGLANRMVSSS